MGDSRGRDDVTPESDAVEQSVFAVRAFVRVTDLARGHAAIAVTLAALERKAVGHEKEVESAFAALRAIMEPPKNAGRPLGFRGE